MGTLFIMAAMFAPAAVFVPLGVKMNSVGVIIGGIYAGIPCMFGMAWIVEIALPSLMRKYSPQNNAEEKQANA